MCKRIRQARHCAVRWLNRLCFDSMLEPTDWEEKGRLTGPTSGCWDGENGRFRVDRPCCHEFPRHKASSTALDEAGPRNDLSLSDSTSFLLKRKHPQSRTHCDADLLFLMIQHSGHWRVAIYHKSRELTVDSMLQKTHTLAVTRSLNIHNRLPIAVSMPGLGQVTSLLFKPSVSLMGPYPLLSLSCMTPESGRSPNLP